MKGETLSQIAKQYGVSVPEIEQLNKIQLELGQPGPDPRSLK